MAADNLQPSRDTRVLIQLGLRALAMASGLVGNFGLKGLVAGTDLALFASTVAGLLLVINVGRRRAPPDERHTSARAGFFRKWPMTALAIGLLLCSGLANELVIGHSLGPAARLSPFALLALRTLQAMAALGGLALLMRRSIARSLRTLATRVAPAPCDPTVLVLFLVVPWAVLVLITEWTRHDRLQGLWPLQVIALAFFWSTLLARSGRGARLVRAGLLLTIGVILVNPFFLSRLEAWRQDGWSGADAVEIRLADHLAGRLRAEGRSRAAVGYQQFIEGPPQFLRPAVDDRWRVGQELDVILQFRHGIENLDKCGEGLAPQDDYRIVEAFPSTPYGTHYYFDVPSAGRLRFLEQIGSHQMYKRD